MWLVSVYVPSLGFTLPWRTAVAVTFVGVGIAISLAGVMAFRDANTTVNPTKPGTLPWSLRASTA
jgi:hypothetical protein